MKGIEELNIQKIQIETRKMLADMEHDLSQREHWKAQQRYWTAAAVFMGLAIITSPFLVAISRYYFP